MSDDANAWRMKALRVPSGTAFTDTPLQAFSRPKFIPPWSAHLRCKLLISLALALAAPAHAEFFLNASDADAAPAYDAESTNFSRQRLTDTNILVGRQGTGSAFHQAAVFPFQLPNFGAVAAPFTNAEFIFRMSKESVSGFNLDLYSLPSRTGSAVLPSSPSTTNRGDFFMGGFLGGPANDNTSGVVKIQDNIATPSTSDGIVQTNIAGGTQLAGYLNAQYNNGAGAGRWVFLRLSTDAVPSGTQRYIISTAEQSTPANRPRIRYNFTEQLYTRIGTDPTFQQLIDSGVIVPGVSSSPGPVLGSTIDVNNPLLDQQTGPTGPIAQPIRIHTQVNSSVLRSTFGNFTRWYQEDGNVQVMRLFEGEQNVRSGIGPDGTPGRIEAFFPMFTVEPATWSVWEATYTIIEPLQSNIFQLFHEGGQLWPFHLRMTNAGAITFNRRQEIAGLPTNITIANNMAGQSIAFRVRANGRHYEVYKKIPFVDPGWVLITTGSYTQAVNNQISFRWGMYCGSQAGQSIPKDGLLFVSGVTRTTEASSNDDPPPTPPPPVTYYWDNNGATSGFGTASGIWGESTTGNATQGWSPSSAGTVLPSDVSTNATDPVFFGTNSTGLGSGTITVSDTVGAANISFGSASGNITLNGGEIQMFGNRIITVGGGTHTIRSALLGDGTRTIAGSGILSLTGDSTFSGPLVIGDNNAGLRLRINSIGNADGTPTAAGAPASSTNGIIQIGAVSNGSTLELTGSTAPQTTNRRIRVGSDGGGGGGATIQNSNTDPAHTLSFTNSAFNVAATDTSSFNRTLTLRGSNSGDNLIQGAIIDNIGGSGGKVGLTKNDDGTWVLAGANTYTGSTNISAGILRIGNGGTTGSLSPSSSISNSGTLEFRRSNTLSQGTDFTTAAISGTGAILQSGTGTTIFNVGNTYQGLTTINAGALRIQHAGALGNTAAGTVVSGTASSGGPRLELAGGITVTGETVTLSGGGNFRGALSSQNGINVWAGNVTITAPETRIGASDAATLRVGGVIGSGGQAHGLTVRAGPVDTGAVILSGANTYLGDTTLLVGKLQLDAGNNRLPVATRFIMGNAADRTEFDLNGRSQQIAGLTLRSGVSAPANNVVTNSSATHSSLTVHTAAGAPSTFAGILHGNLALVKSGPDTLTLTAANTHSGGSTLPAGSGTLQATITQTSNPLGSGPVSIGADSNLLLDNQSTTNTTNLPTIGNVFTGTGLLTLQFAGGTTARNTYLPNATGFGGTIRLSNTGTTGDKWNASNIGTVAASIVVDSGSTLFMSAGTNAFPGGITLNGAGNSENRGALRVSGTSTALSGTIRLASDSTIGMESAAAQITAHITSATAGSQTLTLGGTQGSQPGGILAGAIGGGTGTLHLTVANGSYTLTGINTYTGNTTASQGTLSLAASARLTFVLGPSSGVNNHITGAGNVILNGEFAIDTTAADSLASGTWVLENATNLSGPYGATFRVAGFTDIGNHQWEKILDSNRKYVFDETTGTLTLTAIPGSTYETWAATNAGGQGPNLDFDNDGVANGIEFFLNAAPGFTTLPTLDASNKITWTNGGNIPASEYGTQFVVQTSNDLLGWNDAPVEQLTANTDGPDGFLIFTLTSPAPRFVRLKVTPE